MASLDFRFKFEILDFRQSARFLVQVKDLFREEKNNFLPSTEGRGCFCLRYSTFYLLLFSTSNILPPAFCLIVWEEIVVAFT
ncbi:hypothetical protein C7B69_13520 [filamentous cyanobacterium Phorm 46]|nr:hypothetical protein C7B69_13520 [filamentous cyanobacterium Phorm 46]